MTTLVEERDACRQLCLDAFQYRLNGIVKLVSLATSHLDKAVRQARAVPQVGKQFVHVMGAAFGIDGAPRIDQTAIDLQIDLIQMPGRVGPRPALAQVRGNQRPQRSTERGRCVVTMGGVCLNDEGKGKWVDQASFWSVDAAEAPGKRRRLPTASQEPERMIAFAPF